MDNYKDETEMFKLTLFAIIRNSQVMPMAMNGKFDEEDVDKITILTMKKCIDTIDFDKMRKFYEHGLE